MAKTKTMKALLTAGLMTAMLGTTVVSKPVTAQAASQGSVVLGYHIKATGEEYTIYPEGKGPESYSQTLESSQLEDTTFWGLVKTYFWSAVSYVTNLFS